MGMEKKKKPHECELWGSSWGIESLGGFAHPSLLRLELSFGEVELVEGDGVSPHIDTDMPCPGQVPRAFAHGVLTVQERDPNPTFFRLEFSFTEGKLLESDLVTLHRRANVRDIPQVGCVFELSEEVVDVVDVRVH